MDNDSIAAIVQDDNAAHLAPSMSDPILSGSAVNHVEEMPHNAIWVSGDDEVDYPDFLDAENAPSNGNNLGSGFIPIRVRVSEDVDDDYEGDVEEEGSSSSTGSYDSVSERMGTASITDLASPVGSFVEPFSLPEAASTTQKGALRQLNELDSGFSSLDTSLLENTNEEGFRSRVMKIAKSKSVSPDDDVISNILSALLPMVGKMVKQSSSVGDEALPDTGGYTRIMPVAKPTAEDDDDIDDVELGSSQADINEGASDVEQLEGDVLPDSAKGLRIRGLDEESKQEDSNLLPSLIGKPLFSSDQEETSFELEKESGSLAKVANQIVGESADAEEKPHASLDQGIEPTDMEKHVQSPNEHDLLASSNDSGLHRASQSKDGASLQGTTESSSIGTQDEDDLIAGKREEGRDYVEGEPIPENKGLAREWHPQGEIAITRLELEQAGESNLKTGALAADGLEEGVPPKSRSLDLPAFSSAEFVQSMDLKDTDNVLGKYAQESETMGNTHAADFDALKDKGDIVDTKEKGSLEADSNKDVLEERNDTKVWAFKADNDDDGDDMADNSLPVAAIVSSKSTADPASDTPSLGGAGPSLAVRPIGLGRSIPPLEHAPRAVQRSSGVSAPAPSMEREDSGPNTEISEGNQDAREKLQGIRIKFLRLAHRLGQPPHNAVVAQVLYRLGLAEQLRGGRGVGRPGVSSSERASLLAEEQEAAGHEDLDFECTIMLLGKSGVGKSATINSLFDEIKAGTDAYSPATKKVQVVTGTVHGIKLRVIDTPGLLNSFADQRHNRRVMSSVKRFIKKSPPDIVLYFDRLDMQTRDYGDLPLLQTITDTFGAAVWFNAIVVFTHAASAPPDGANGGPINYEMFVAQRSHVVQQTIRQAAGDMRLMNPVSLVENHAACRTNRAGQRVLPNGQVWKSQLLLLCFASKILAEANSLLKLQDSTPGKPFGVRSRGPPLPYLLSSLLQSRAQLKLPDEQADDDEVSEDESEGEEADSDGEEEYDDLPPFRRLTKDELKLLDKDQRRIYFEELDYREKLFMKKQLKDERERRKERKRRLATLPKEVSEYMEDRSEEENASAAVPVAMPDMALPPSFDSDNPSYRYRYLDSANQWLVRPVLETHGWDHDSGYDGLNVEKTFVISRKVPASISGQVTKDKKEANLQMECAASFRNGDGKVTLTGLDIQTIGKDLAYTIRSETRFNNFKRNKTTCGLSVTTLGDTIAAGMKLEDRLMVGKRLKVLVNGGALTGRGDVAYGGSLEASFRGKDYPIDRSFSTFGLSIMNWHGDLAIGGNLQLQVQLGKNLLTGRANLNNRGSGQISIRVNSSEQLQMALIGLIPLVRAFINNRILNSTEPAR